MPSFTSTRVFEPWALSANVAFDAADLNKAFVESNSPSDTTIEELYYAIFSGVWLTTKLSTQLAHLSEVARLIEEADMAKKVSTTMGPPVPKRDTIP